MTFRAKKVIGDGWVFDQFHGQEKHLIGAYNDTGLLLGMCVYGPARDKIDGFGSELYAINIPQAYQGKGLGRQMVEYVKQDLRSSRKESFYLWCTADNQRAKLFYESLGFKKLSGEKIEQGLVHVSYGLNL